MTILRRFFTWFTMPCAACRTRLYFGARVYSSQHVYCSRRCYEIGLVIEQSMRNRQPTGKE